MANDDLEVGADLATRLLRFGSAALRLSAKLPRDSVGKHVALQWVRAATSAGANYEEARVAESPLDFAHKAGIAAKEAREARYWVRLVEDSGWLKAETSALTREGGELAAMLFSSARTAKRRAQ
jgi:four helix bundle protein